jgi:STE24 endopeptidase
MPSSDINRSDLAKSYARIRNGMFVADTAITLGLLALASAAGWSTWLADRARAVSDCPWIQTAIYGATLITAAKVGALPLTWYGGFHVEHRFGLSTQTPRAWWWDQAKAWAVSLVFGTVALEALYACLRITGPWWWIWAGLVFFVFGVLMSALFPVMILPLFFKLTPLEHPSLRQKLERLAGRVNVRVIGVFRMGMSSKTRKANAAFAGLGRTRRIILGDTLLDHFDEDEIEVVMAHEMAHYKNRDIARMIAWGAMSTFAAFWWCDAALRIGLERWGEAGRADLAAFPFLALIMYVCHLALMPVTNALSRQRERAADRGALEMTGNRDGFIRAMQKLADQNLADVSPHPTIEFLLHSHPSISRRIAFAEQWKPS